MSLDTCPIAPSLEPLTERVCKLETKVDEVAKQSAQVSSDTAAIRKAIVGVSRAGIFVKRHGPRLASAVLGIAIGSGFFSEATVHKLRIALLVMLGH